MKHFFVGRIENDGVDVSLALQIRDFPSKAATAKLHALLDIRQGSIRSTGSATSTCPDLAQSIVGLNRTGGLLAQDPASIFDSGAAKPFEFHLTVRVARQHSLYFHGSGETSGEDSQDQYGNHHDD